LRSGKVMLWDYCFEMPDKKLEAERTITQSVDVGTVTHKLKLADNDKLALVDWPGRYVQLFDGIEKGGGEKPADLQKIFDWNQHYAQLGVEAEAVASLSIRGGSMCPHFSAGHKFNLSRPPNADGAYVLTQVTHDASQSMDLSSGSSAEFLYANRFACLPAALPFRPPLDHP